MPKSDGIHENINTFTLLTFDFIKKDLGWWIHVSPRYIGIIDNTAKTDAIVTPLQREYSLQEKLFKAK